MTQLSLLLLRIGLGALLLTHGVPKLQRLFAEGPVQFSEVLGMSAGLSLGLAVFAEFLCSILIMVGLFTRYAAVVLTVLMVIIVFVVHGDDGLSRQELPLLYLLGFLVVLLNGAGKISLDHLIWGKKGSSRY
ncbi:MAG: DoxX family protein [Solitalea sp.]